MTSVSHKPPKRRSINKDKCSGQALTGIRGSNQS
jgi:hypothetical protein